MTILRIAFLALLSQVASSQNRPQAPATASIEGIVVKLGTNEPIAGADVELTRVEGTAAAPLPPGAAEVLARALVLGGGNNSAVVSAAIATEVQYARSGENGRFAFRNLKEGKYRLVSIKIGGMYQPAEFGQRDPSGRGLNFPVTEGQAVAGLKLEMAPTGVISGKVLDEDGQPLGHIRVTALAQIFQNGRRYLTTIGAVHTDDHGEYRLFWLPPGRYYVAARFEDLRRRVVPLLTVPPGRAGMTDVASAPIVSRIGDGVEETTALVYYGGVLDPDQAKPLEVRPGATVAGTDISMGVGKMRSWHIRGTVIGSNGQPARGADVTAIPRQWSPNVFVLNGTAGADGSFDLAGAVQGSYALFARASAPQILPDTARAAYAAAGIDIARLARVTTELGYVPVDMGSADVGGIKIITTLGIGLKGSVSIEGRPRVERDPDLEKITVSLRRDPDIFTMPEATIPLPPPPGSAQVPPAGKVGPDGKFDLLAAQGDFQVAVSGIPSNSYVKSIRMGNVDIMSGGLQVNGPPDGPIEVVIGTDGGEVTGSVSNERLEPMANVIVALLPDSPLLRKRFGLYRSGTTDFAGKFRLQNIPPGTYKVFSWEYADPDAWQDAQFLQVYESFGKTLTVREGSTQETQLKVTPLRR
jgi:hypothetical protein